MWEVGNEKTRLLDAALSRSPDDGIRDVLPQLCERVVKPCEFGSSEFDENYLATLRPTNVDKQDPYNNSVILYDSDPSLIRDADILIFSLRRRSQVVPS